MLIHKVVAVCGNMY